MIERAQRFFGMIKELNGIYPIGYCILDLPRFPRHAHTILRYRERLTVGIYPNVLSMHQAMVAKQERVNPYLELLPTRLLKFISGFENLQRIDF